ncbi:MAG TPA: DUF2383 domain-containing protein [Polyangiaceae bacterium]|nr:DUF2383 domain-containing protein [Polyangiaceae bacterium]
MANDATSSIAQLNSFLRSELSAVETYQDVLERATGASARATLEDCSSSHESRAQRLREAITLLGGTPATSSGALGTLARLFGRSALALGGRTGVAALARGEDRVLREYRDNLGRLDPKGKNLVEELLLPSQEHTTRVIHDLSWTLS